MKQLGYGTKQFTYHFNISSNKRREKINVWKSLTTIPSVAKPHFFAMLPDMSFPSSRSMYWITIQLGLGDETYAHHVKK